MARNEVGGDRGRRGGGRGRRGGAPAVGRLSRPSGVARAGRPRGGIHVPRALVIIKFKIQIY